MIDEEELARRKMLTFEQAEGVAPLPRQLDRDEMPAVLRARLFQAVIDAIDREQRVNRLSIDVGESWHKALVRLYVEHFGVLSDNFSKARHKHATTLRSRFQEAQPKEVYGITQAICRFADNSGFSHSISQVLQEERGAYRLIENTLVPFGSSEEAENFQRAISEAEASGLGGAHKHLLDASSALSDGRFADCIREGIQAVESVVRSLTGKKKLSDALDELSKRRPFHASFRDGIAKLYGYSSDEPGIRHPLLERGDANVSEEDALLMLGICASLVTYFSRTFR